MAPRSELSETRELPTVGLLFWAMKIAATTLGETAGDLLSMTLHLGYAVTTFLLLQLFLLSVAAQLTSQRLRPWLYWTVILSTSTAGTTLSDYVDRSLGLGYAGGVVVLSTTLIAVLALWRGWYGALSFDRLDSRGVEAFYWTTILVSNTLGTAAGDYLADDSGLGFLGAAVVIGSVLAAVGVTSRLTSRGRVGLFWCAFVLTRPLGATVGDLLTKPPTQAGLGLGTVASSVLLALALGAGVAWSSRRSAVDPNRDGAATVAVGLH